MSDEIDVSSLFNIRTATPDLNGQPRGKAVPPSKYEGIKKHGVRFPFSVMNLDIWGEDIEDSPLVFESGDSDGVLWPTDRGLLPTPWLKTPSALLPLWMYEEDGVTPYGGDPRHALAKIIAELGELGLRPIAAMEMELYLLIAPETGPESSPDLVMGLPREGGEILSLRELELFDPFFHELQIGCQKMGIEIDGLTSEAGPGQFEVNLLHRDAMRVADDAWLFKMLAQGIGRKMDLNVSFMAKPLAEQPGNGMHVHMSLLDDTGRNMFDDGTDEGTPLLKHVVAGMLDGLSELALLYAPHFNSFQRLIPNTHAPTNICWAYENRTASIRIPGGAPQARRIEHRVCGGDVNPYLALAGILGSALHGIRHKLTPPAPISGNAYEMDLPQLPDRWLKAIDAFEASPIATEIFAPELIENFVATKRQERKYIHELDKDERISLYLERL